MTSLLGLDRLLSPRRIAVVGASPTLDRAPMRIVDNLARSGYTGEIYPVNPKYDEVFGLRCYASLSELPETPDVVTLSIGGRHLLGVLEEAARLGVPAAMIYAAAYNETGVDAEALEEELREFVARTGMRILGPSTQGSYRIASRACLSWSAAYSGADLTKQGPIGWISQSGAIGTALLGLIDDLGVGLSHWISTGNETDLEFSEIASYVLDDPQTTAICGYVETIHDVAGFRAMTQKARALGKPVVLLKGGMSESGSAAAASHTGALASDAAVFEGFFRQCGVILAQDLDELSTIAWMIQYKPGLRHGGRTAVMCNSGGLGIVLADIADREGLSVPQLGPQTREAIRPLLPDYVEAGNPVDMPVVMMRRPEDLPAMLAEIHSREDFDAYLLTILGVRPQAAYDLPAVFDAIRAAETATEGRVVPVLFAGTSDIVEQARAAGVHALSDAPRAIAALAKLSRTADPAPVAEPQTHGSLERGAPLNEAEAKRMLAASGIPVPAGVVALNPDEAAAAVARTGLPAAIKILSRDIPHKTDVGGVRLNVGSAHEAAEAAADIIAEVAHRSPQARIEGCLVEPMAAPGVDVVIGMHLDPALGPVLMFGLGGVDVELHQDVSFRVPPIDVATAKDMIRQTRAAALLSGWRGAPPSDIDALAQLLVDTGALVAAQEDGALLAFEMNPVRVYPGQGGVVVLDALCVTRDLAGDEPGSR